MDDAFLPHMPDLINNPRHYTTGGLEVIDILHAKMSTEEFRGFLRGNVIKYILRAPHKGHPQNDYMKAQWYLNALLADHASRK